MAYSRMTGAAGVRAPRAEPAGTFRSPTVRRIGRPLTGPVYRTPIYGYTGLAGIPQGDGLGFNLFKAIGSVVTAPVKLAAKGATAVGKGAYAAGKFVVKHPLTVAAPIAAVGLTAVGVPVLPAAFGIAKGAVKIGGKVVTAPIKAVGSLFGGRQPTASVTPSRVSQAPAVQAETATTVADIGRQTLNDLLQQGNVSAGDVPSVTGPTWQDALKKLVAQVGTDTLNTVKTRAINTIMDQPGVRATAGRIARQVVGAEGGVTGLLGLPSWLLPVGIGVGALVLGMAVSRSRPAAA